MFPVNSGSLWLRRYWSVPKTDRNVMSTEEQWKEIEELLIEVQELRYQEEQRRVARIAQRFKTVTPAISTESTKK